MKKRVLLSLTYDNTALAQALCAEIAKCGLEPQAHLWSADREDTMWNAVAGELSLCHVWIIVCNDLKNITVRRNLSLVALAIQAEKGNGFPIIISPSSASADMNLPDPLKGADVVTKNLGAKVAAKAALFPVLTPEYRIKPLAPEGLGLWFEVGPVRDPWSGVFFASGSAQDNNSGNESKNPGIPNAHGIGSAGCIPSKSILQYPLQGAQLEIRGVQCEGWGAKNQLTPSASYYVRMVAVPDILAFGPFPETDDAEMFTLSLI